MPDIDQNALRLALQRTTAMHDATDELPQNASDMVMVHAEDAHALRAAAMEHLTSKPDFEMSLPINALNKRFVEYGSGQLLVRLPRSAFENQLYLKPYVTVTVNREK